MTLAAKADVLERTAAQVAVEPVGENTLVGAPELTGTGKNTAAVDENRQVECLAVFERESFGRELGRAIEGNGRLGAEGLVDTGGGQAGGKARGQGRRAKGVGDGFDGEIGEGRNRINAARAEQDETGAVLLAVLEHIDRADEVVVDQFAGGSFAVDTGEYAGICGRIDDEVDSGQTIHCSGVAQVSCDDFGPEFLERLTVSLTAGTNVVVEAGDHMAAYDKFTRQGAANETADAGDEDAHGGARPSVGFSTPRQSGGWFPRAFA